MDVLKLLGIYPDAIKSVADTCKGFLDEYQDILTEIGESDNNIRNIDIEAAVLDMLATTKLSGSLTNPIIEAYYTILDTIVINSNILSEFDISIAYDVNCDASYLNICVKNGTAISSEGYSCGSNILHHVFLHAIVNQLAVITGFENVSNNDIFDAILHGNISLSEAIDCIREGKLSEEVEKFLKGEF